MAAIECPSRNDDVRELTVLGSDFETVWVPEFLAVEKWPYGILNDFGTKNVGATFNPIVREQKLNLGFLWIKDKKRRRGCWLGGNVGVGGFNDEMLATMPSRSFVVSVAISSPPGTEKVMARGRSVT